MSKNIFMIFVLVVYVICSSLGMILINSVGDKNLFLVTKVGISIDISWKFFLGLFLYVLSFVLWIYVLQVFPVSYISPVSYGLVFVSILILSCTLFDSVINIKQIVGGIIIILGVWIASM